MPLLPASLIEPLWVELAALIGSDERPEFAPTHPWGCHRRRIPDRVVFEHLIGAFVHGSGYERIATPGCSDRTMRRRLHEWADAGHGPALLRICLTAYDQIIGLDLDELAVDGCITKAPCGGEVAGRSPVDRGKQGMKRSAATDGHGIPLHVIAARANAHDSPLLEPTLAGVVEMIGTLPQYRDLHGGDDFPNLHLDRGYDSTKTRDLLDVLGFTPHIAVKGQPAPIQAGSRWPVERTHSWMNGYGKLRRCTDRRKVIVEFWLCLAAAFTVIRRLINRARNRYRWPTRPSTRRLR
ncbi:IS5 family transposase [Pseudonocardia charpentierae]|uniref:IS5 family transposase n=1 Tax=Pseudonocardia charpentierae TaxID=3075545 RepID=A0ABU2NJ98_9PSEU|nr:IS5 family transposase [Pseudonocardia sp. DSM 45834]MDT0354045.1 IS5 family transposase [Pseudonocardia sp. DSM 45834]